MWIALCAGSVIGAVWLGLHKMGITLNTRTIGPILIVAAVIAAVVYVLV